MFREQDGDEIEVASLEIGEYFGEMSLLQGGRHTASVRTVTPVDLLVMGGEDFLAVATSSTGFHEFLNRAMSQRLSEGQAAELAEDSADLPGGRSG